MTAERMEIIIDEVEHSLATEKLVMTDAEKENLRRVGRGEISYQDLIAEYVAAAHKMAATHA